ncbi:hypothetical protein [Paraburkholderia tropica]|uniref:hypothetical protein n=1 Tax=Paraburkholderia tropica TaxID=92647 RepID=UPI002AB65527|nr:hypothetical protein [Paraburkholderia tropica]
MAPKPHIQDGVKRLLRDIGPMTVAELARELGSHTETVRVSVNSCRKAKEKEVYILRFEYGTSKTHAPAVFAYGDKPDAKRLTESKRKHLAYERTKFKRALMRSGLNSNPFNVLIKQVAK